MYNRQRYTHILEDPSCLGLERGPLLSALAVRLEHLLREHGDDLVQPIQQLLAVSDELRGIVVHRCNRPWNGSLFDVFHADAADLMW